MAIITIYNELDNSNYTVTVNVYNGILKDSISGRSEYYLRISTNMRDPDNNALPTFNVKDLTDVAPHKTPPATNFRDLINGYIEYYLNRAEYVVSSSSSSLSSSSSFSSSSSSSSWGYSSSSNSSSSSSSSSSSENYSESSESSSSFVYVSLVNGETVVIPPSQDSSIAFRLIGGDGTEAYLDIGVDSFTVANVSGNFVFDLGGVQEYTFSFVGEETTIIADGKSYIIRWDGLGSLLFVIIPINSSSSSSTDASNSSQSMSESSSSLNNSQSSISELSSSSSSSSLNNS